MEWWADHFKCLVIKKVITVEITKFNQPISKPISAVSNGLQNQPRCYSLRTLGLQHWHIHDWMNEWMNDEGEHLPDAYVSQLERVFQNAENAKSAINLSMCWMENFKVCKNNDQVVTINVKTDVEEDIINQSVEVSKTKIVL